MGCGLALSSLTTLLLAASVEPAASLRVEARGTRHDADGQVPASRGAASTIPQLSLTVDGAPLRLQAGYAATLWTSDVGVQRSALVNHAVDARLGVRPAAPWRASASGRALWGETDPLATMPASGGASQLATTGPIDYRSLSAEARVERQLDPRSTLGAAGRWSDTRVQRGALRSLFPPQRGAGGTVSLDHRVTLRDVLTAGASAEWAETRTAAGNTTGLSVSTDATWRRALAPALDGWVRAGAGWLYSDEPAAAPRRALLPLAGVGVSRPGAGARLVVEAAANVTSAVDRFRGDVQPAVDARLGVTWAAAQRLSLSGQASGGRRLDGGSTVAAAELRAAWTLRRWVALDVGVLWRLQRERRPELPSFSEGGAFVGLQMATGRR